MKRIKVLFITYAAAEVRPNQPAMIGVLKRCLRIIDKLSEKIEIHLINFGPIPIEDPLWVRVFKKVELHSVYDLYSVERFLNFFQSIQVDVIVLGEGPGEGLMVDAYDSASALGIPMICIDNYYHEFKEFFQEFPKISQWLLLGLPFKGRFGRLDNKTILCPPLLPTLKQGPPEVAAITILGYHSEVAFNGFKLLGLLKSNPKIRLIGSNQSLSEIYPAVPQELKSRLIITGLPSDNLLKYYFETSNIVICKNGFQQMVECLALGTPLIANDAYGGVPQDWLAPQMRPYIRFFPRYDWQFKKIIDLCEEWLAEKPLMPWTKKIKKIADPIDFAAGSLLHLIHKCLS